MLLFVSSKDTGDTWGKLLRTHSHTHYHKRRRRRKKKKPHREILLINCGTEYLNNHLVNYSLVKRHFTIICFWFSSPSLPPLVRLIAEHTPTPPPPPSLIHLCSCFADGFISRPNEDAAVLSFLACRRGKFFRCVATSVRDPLRIHHNKQNTRNDRKKSALGIEDLYVVAPPLTHPSLIGDD